MATSRLRGFRCEMLIRANFGEFLGMTDWNCEIIDLTPKGTHFPRRHAFWDIACWNRFSGLICSLLQILALRKKVIGRSPKGYISPIWEEAPSNRNVTKFCMWVPFPDVIICARFYLYRPSSFLGGGGPPKIGCSHWLEGSPLQQLELYRALLWYITDTVVQSC